MAAATPDPASTDFSMYPMTYNSHKSMLALGYTLSILVVLAMVMRMVSHKKYFKKIEMDDILIVPAFVLVLGLGISVIVATTLGHLGSHSAPGIPDFVWINQFEYGFWIAYVLAIGFIKLSLLFFFRRLFKSHAYRSSFDIANWTLIGITTAWTIAFTLNSIFICGSDPSALWTTSFWIQQKCVNTYALFTACAASNFIIDLGIVIEPLVIVSKLHMSLGKKFQAILIFSLSGFAVVAGLMRMVFWIQSNIGGHERLLYTEVGLTYPITDLEALVTIGIFWTFMEAGVGFIVACFLPSAKLLDSMANSPFFHKLRSLPSIISTRSKSSIRSKDSIRNLGKDSDQMSQSASSYTSRPKESFAEPNEKEFEFFTSSGRNDSRV